MGDATDRLLALRPVIFRYKQEVAGDDRPLQYGLIAEEVAEIFPELVVYDEEGEPLTVRYHILSSMLLNELKKLSAERELDRTEHARDRTERALERKELEEALEELRTRLASLEARVPPGG